jgi:disulfide bond formation protein DsbB
MATDSAATSSISAGPLPVAIFAGFLFASAAALAAVFVFQFGFGLAPCILCLWQRLPHAIAILLSGIGVGSARSAARVRDPYRAAPWGTFAAIAALLLVDHLAGTGIAAFHVGVEQHWWAGTAACTGESGGALSADQLSAQLLGTEPARCDEIAWSLFGISLAGYNFLLSAALAAAAAWSFVRFGRERRTIRR